MLAVLIMLTPGRRNNFIECQNAKVRFVVLPIMDLKIHWNITMEVLERAYGLREFTREWLKNPWYTDYLPLFPTKFNWTIVKYIVEVLRAFQHWTRLMSKGHTVTQLHVITVYNDMFNQMDGVMRRIPQKKTHRREDLYFAVKFARLKLSK